MDRDCAPHIGRGDNQTPESGKRRPPEASVGPAKDRVNNFKTVDDHQSSDSKPINRRTLDRYLPDRDRDEDRLRNRDRERERDSERDKNRRPNANPRDGTSGDDHLNWRRSAGPVSSQPNNKRSVSDHHPINPSRGDKDHDSRDHSAREKDREKGTNHHAQASHPPNRNLNQQRVREREKEIGGSNPSSSQLGSSTSVVSSSREAPPISPSVPLTSHLTKRVKDGAWDSGQGKWEISKPVPGFQSDGSFGTSETDAIQTWKAEMKALEAKKKLAAAAASSQSASEALESHPPDVIQSSLKTDDGLESQTLASKESVLELDSKSDRDSPSNSSLPIPSAADSHQKPFSFLAPEIPPSVNPGGSNDSYDGNDLAVLPRASRFAKFFDHHKDEGQQAESLLKVENLSQKHGPSKGPRSPSADPENMARVLSMLQMSSKQTLEPTPETAPTPQSNSSSLLHKFLPSSGQSSHHNQDLAGFLQQQPPLLSSPTASLPQGVHPSLRIDLNDRTRPAHEVSLVQPTSATHPPSSSPFGAFSGNSQRRPSLQSPPAHQMRGLEELSNHPPPEHFNTSSVGPLSATAHSFSQTGYGNSGGNLSASHSIAAPINQSFNLFSTNYPVHVKSPVDNGSNSLRNQNGLEPQMFQLQHLLHSSHTNNLGSVPSQHPAQDRNGDNQKLAFLTRQLHQQRLSPSHVINQVNGANNLNTLMSLNNGSSTPASLQQPNNRQSANQFDQLPQNVVEYQRVPIVTPPSLVNGTNHTLQHLNSSGGPNGVMHLPPTNTSHSSLNNLLLNSHHHQQVAPHHPGIIPQAVNFTSPPGHTNLGNVRPGPLNFAHQTPQMHPGLQHHPMNHQQLQLQQQLQQLQRQQGLSAGNFSNPSANPNLTFPFLGPNNRAFGPGFGNLNNFGVVPLVQNAAGVNNIPQQIHQQVQPQPHPPPSLTNSSGLPGLPAGGGVSHPYQLGGGNLTQQPPITNNNPQVNSSIQSPLDLMTLLNAGNQRRIGM